MAQVRTYRREAAVVDAGRGRAEISGHAAPAQGDGFYRIWLDVELGPLSDPGSDEDSSCSEEDEPPRARPRQTHSVAEFSQHAPPSSGPAFYFPALQAIHRAADHPFTDDEVEVATFLAAAAEHPSAPPPAPCTFAIGV